MFLLPADLTHAYIELFNPFAWHETVNEFRRDERSSIIVNLHGHCFTIPWILIDIPRLLNGRC